MKRKSLLLMMLLALFSSGAWAQTAYHSYTATAGTAGNSSSEGYARLVDNNTSTKWCIVQSGNTWSNTAYIEFYSAAPIIPVQYVLTTGNDNASYQGRNPKTWVIKAKVNSGDGWTTIASESNNTTMKNVNYTPYTFNCNNSSNTAYKYFRFEVSAIQSGGVFQLSELHFLVGEGGGSSYITEINNNNDWNNFAQSVRNGLDYSGKTVTLKADISITSQSNQAGSSGNLFRGTFEGHGNTINVNMTATGNQCAPFYGIEDATINDLVVTGSITSSYNRVGGISGEMEGNSTITNCISKVAITSTNTGEVSVGGFIGFSSGGANPTFVGCAFTGSITGVGTCFAGFIGFHQSRSGWAGNYGGVSTYTNCVVAPSNININNINATAVFTCGYTNGQYVHITTNNSYYNEEGAKMSTKQGTRVYSVTGQSPVTVAMAGDPSTQYSVSGIKVYNPGITLTTNNNTTIYAASGEALSLTLNGSGAGYLADHGTLSDSGNPYTLTMTTSNTVISAVTAPPASLPYTEDFENGQNGWEFANGGYTNHWTIGTATSVSSSHSLYVTNGTANEYSTGSSSYVYAYRELNFTAAGDYLVSFKWKANGESGCWDAMYAALVPQGTACPPSSNITGSANSLPSGYINASNASTAFLWGQSSWQTSTKPVSIPSAGIYTLVFYWKNDGGGGSNPPAAVDDIDIHADLPPITEIYTVADWEAFCSAVNSGHSYSSKTVTLMNDITTAVTTMAGTITEETVGNAFKGTFDGQGHKLTLDISGGASSGWYFTAPFRCIDGATIKNLKTTGTVTQTGGKGAAGIVGCSIGACTITNCVSNVTIESQTNGDGTHGGFISFIKSGSVTFNGCAFTGSITGSSTRYCGGFVGWNSGTATFNNCVFAPTAITFDADHSGDNSANFSRISGTFNNCYYTQTCGSTIQGKLMHSITGASGITVANAGTATSYTPETSTIVGYGTGIKYNDVLYAGNGESLSLTLSGANTYEADHGTLTGSGNPYTLEMAASNTVISGISCTAPTNLRCAYYTTNSVTLAWTAGGDEEAWQVKCWPSNQTEPGDLDGYTTNVSTNPSNPSYTLTNLTEGQTYHVKVRAKCDENDFSDWTSSIDVTPGRMTYYFVGSTNDNGWNTINNWRYYVGNEPYTATTLPTIEDNVRLQANVTIPNDCTATANEITADNDTETGNPYTITIADGGQLQHNNTGVTAKAEKVITGYGSENVNTNMGYYLISSPITGGTNEFTNLVPSNTNEYDLYSFNFTSGNGLLEWVDVTGEDGTQSLDKTVGYLYARQTTATISTPEGTILPSDTDKPIYLQYDGNGTYRFDGWNLVGNPFVCNAYVSGYKGEDDGEGGYQPSKTAAQLSYYVLNSAGNDFVVPQPLGAIAPMGAIMVQATAANQFAVFSRTAPTSKGGSLNLNITSNATRGTIDRAVLAFGNTMPLGKFQLNPDHTKVYIPMDGNDYAVAKVEGAGAVPVNFKAEHSGRYTISVNAEEVSFNYLHLIDNMTGADIDLLATPSYSFESRTTDYESRFRLVFATGDNSASESFAFFSNGTYVINNDGDATLQVIDLTGRVLSSEAIHGSVSKAIQAAPGVYMLRLINGNDVKVQKVVVR